MSVDEAATNLTLSHSGSVLPDSAPPSLPPTGMKRRPGQYVFDVAAGIVLPLICLYFDPIVFQSDFGRPMFAAHATLGYISILVGIFSLSGWLILHQSPALFAGLLAGGAAFAALVGLAMLPLSLLTLAVGIGFLGLVPFATAFVFWKSAVDAYRAARPFHSGLGLKTTATLGFIVACGVPWLTEWHVRREVAHATNMVMSDNPEEASSGVRRLEQIRFVTNFDDMISKFTEEKDETRKNRLAQAYVELRGKNIWLTID